MADFGLKQDKGFGKRAIHSHSVFQEIPPGVCIPISTHTHSGIAQFLSGKNVTAHPLPRQVRGCLYLSNSFIIHQV